MSLAPELLGDKGLTQSHDKGHYTNRKIRKVKWQKQKRHQNRRLHSDCGPTWDGQLK